MIEMVIFALGFGVTLAVGARDYLRARRKQITINCDCGAPIRRGDQKYCEMCGVELDG
jgi:hypothetical protein